jgi:hypothetical protein
MLCAFNGVAQTSKTMKNPTMPKMHALDLPLIRPIQSGPLKQAGPQPAVPLDCSIIASAFS